MKNLGWVIPARVPARRSADVGWWNGTGMTNLGSGNTFMLVLVSTGKKRPWGKNKTHIPRVKKDTGPHPRRHFPVSVLVAFWRMAPMPELIEVPEVRVAIFSGWEKCMGSEGLR